MLKAQTAKQLTAYIKMESIGTAITDPNLLQYLLKNEKWKYWNKYFVIMIQTLTNDSVDAQFDLNAVLKHDRCVDCHPLAPRFGILFLESLTRAMLIFMSYSRNVTMLSFYLKFRRNYCTKLKDGNVGSHYASGTIYHWISLPETTQ